MFAIQTYTNTKCELEMAKKRLNLLIDRQTKLYSDYFPITPKLKEISVDGGERNNDKMADYLHELHCVDIGTGKSLAEEISYHQEKIKTLEATLDTMTTTLAGMEGIEYSLYYEIVVNGSNVTRAVELVAERYDKDVQTIWKYHYKKIKRDIRKISKFKNEA